MSQLYVLFEHAAGYALFRVAEFEEVTMMLPQVEESVKDLAKFRSIVQLVAFKPFKTGQDALENINSVSEGILHPSLQLFLETSVPKSKKKKQPVILGVADSKIGSAITEALQIVCQHTGVVPEILRGVRRYFHNLVSGFKEDTACKAQLGLGHNYSRAKVKFNVNRVDNMIIQSICLLDQLDKDINTFAMRIREWYSYHFPELIKIVPENSLYIQVVNVIKNRREMPDDIDEKLEEILMDSTKVQNILEVSKSSMGMDISPIDLINIECFASRVNSLVAYRKQLMEYLKSRMHDVAPSLAVLIGEMVGARLISHAGSLTNLAKFPASTVQILGAEKALFRALKTRGNTPKYGLIYHSTFIGRAAKQNKGRISRFLANKCALASRIDCFSEIPTEVFGQKLRQQVEDRLKFFESGDIPEKNIDVMTAAADEVAALQEHLMKKKRKQEKKEKKRKQQEMANIANSTLESSQNSLFESSAAETDGNTSAFNNDEDLDEVPKKKRKKRSKFSESGDISDENIDVMTDEAAALQEHLMKKKRKQEKKKKKQQEMANSVLENSQNSLYDLNNEDHDDIPKKKRKKVF